MDATKKTDRQAAIKNFLAVTDKPNMVQLVNALLNILISKEILTGEYIPNNELRISIGTKSGNRFYTDLSTVARKPFIKISSGREPEIYFYNDYRYQELLFMVNLNYISDAEITKDDCKMFDRYNIYFRYKTSKEYRLELVLNK